MTLKLTLAGHAQLWAELVMPQGDRVFIVSQEAYEVGTPVPVTLEVVEPPTSLTVRATVVGHRPATPTTPAGLVVTFDAAAVDRVRSLLAHAPPSSDSGLLRLAGASRNEGQFSARVLIPEPVDGCVVKNLSPHGCSLSTPRPLGWLPESTAVISAHLGGSDVQLPAVVAWVRPELNLAGLRFSTLDPGIESALQHALADVVHHHAVATPTGITLLVADDDPAILDFMTRVLSALGHRVVRADRGDAALQLIRHERPKVAFLDVLMPGLDGLEVCKAIREDPALGKTPVVLLSAMGEARLAETVREAKANDYLTKPMKMEAVRAILSKYV